MKYLLTSPSTFDIYSFLDGTIVGLVFTLGCAFIARKLHERAARRIVNVRELS